MNIDSTIIAAVIGAIFGGLGSFVVARYKLKGRRDYFDDEAIKLLESKLVGHPKGRTTKELCNIGKAIGISRDDTKQLLLLSKAKMLDERGNRWVLERPEIS